MKKTIIKMLIAGCTLSSLYSCYPKQQFYVSGPAGTIITNKNDRVLATIPSTGNTKIEFPRSAWDFDSDYSYNPLLFARDPNHDERIPFALNYKPHNRSFRRTIGATLEITILLPTIVPAILVSMQAETGMKDYDFDYLQQQTTNNDIIK